ncbi:sporulation protein rmd1 [Pleodorina starrii]|nr:sporulation protein rmd1 [Pleodorina starrii]
MDAALQPQVKCMNAALPQLRRSNYGAPQLAAWRQCQRTRLHCFSPAGLHPLPRALITSTRPRRMVAAASAADSRPGSRAAATAEHGMASDAGVSPAAEMPSPSGDTSSSSSFATSSYSTTNGIMDNSSIVSMDWNDWMYSSSSSSSDGEGLSGNDGAGSMDGGGPAAGGPDNGFAGAGPAAGGAMPTSGAVAAAAAGGGVSTTIRIAFYAVAASFDRRQLEARLKTAYGNQAVRKYPDVIHCQLSRGRELQPGTDVFFFDYGVVACWGMSPDAERELVQNLAVQCAVQPLPDRNQERDVFRCTFATNPLDVNLDRGQAGADASAGGGGGGAPAAPVAPAPAAPTPAAPAAADTLGSLLDVEYGSGGSIGSTSGTTSNRRYTRRAERSGGAVVAVTAAAAAPLPTPAAPAPPVPPQPPAAVGPFSFLSFPPKISDDTVLLHVRHCGDTATLLAVSYALAQSTKLSAFEHAVEAIVRETRGLPEALAEHGEVHLSVKEIGKLIGKVFVLKRSVNLLGSVADTPEVFWYAPDQLQSLYTRITEYVELPERVEQLNGRFAVLQEMLELLRAQEENRHGNRLEWTVIWLIVVEVVLGLFELLELFGVIGPKNTGV